MHKIIVNNFCTSKELEPSLSKSMYETTTTTTTTITDPTVSASLNSSLNTNLESSSKATVKKAVKFKSGLVSERSFRNYSEALISKEQVGKFNFFSLNFK